MRTCGYVILWYFLDGVGTPTITAWQRDVTLVNAGIYLIKYAVNYNYKLIYPFVEHKIFAAWIQDMSEHHRTLSHEFFFIHKNP